MNKAILNMVLVAVTAVCAIVGKVVFKNKSTEPIQDALENIVEAETGIDIGDVIDDMKKVDESDKDK